MLEFVEIFSSVGRHASCEGNLFTLTVQRDAMTPSSAKEICAYENNNCNR